MNWTIVAVLVASVGLVVSFFQWHVNQNYKRLDQRFDEWARKVASIERSLLEAERLLEHTRAELHKDYISSAAMKEFRGEMRGDFQNLFKRMNGISRDLERLIGAHNKATGHSL